MVVKAISLSRHRHNSSTFLNQTTWFRCSLTAVVWSLCRLFSRWWRRQCSALFVCCKTIENHFPISVYEAETTEHERFSTAAACSCWLMTSCWWMTALWGDGTCHWQMMMMMMHRNGRSYRSTQADAPIFNNLMSDAGADSNIIIPVICQLILSQIGAKGWQETFTLLSC